jgi:hypothetical protein
MVGARYLFFGTEAVVEEASGAMAPRFEGHVHLRSYASLVGFLLMPHLVTNNHARRHRSTSVSEASTDGWAEYWPRLTGGMPTCMHAYVRDHRFLEGGCDTRGAR